MKKYIGFLFCLMMIPSLVFAGETEIVTLDKCVDGDTANFKTSTGTVYKTRFLAVDTPETVHPTKEVEAYGKEASNYTCETLTNAKEIKLEYDDNSDRASCIPEKFVINGGEIIFSWSATLFIDIWCGDTCALNQHLFKVTPLNYPQWFVFLSTQRHIQTWKNLISAKATSMGHIKREDLENALVFLPPSKLLIEQDMMFSCLFDYHFRLRKENLKLIELQSLLLAKMGQYNL